MRAFAGKFASIVGVATAVLFLGAGAASAHVTVAAPGVTAGSSDAAITLRVPDESATASTVGVKVQLPMDHPIVGVLVEPVTGWTAKITKSKLAKPITTDDGTVTEVVSEIDWTADADADAGIKPGFFGQFPVIAGKLPDGADALTFKAIQVYSDKSVVAWIEQAAAGSTAQPDHPAPTLNLAAGASAAAPGTSTTAPAAPASPGSSAGAAPISAASVTAASIPLAETNAASKDSVTWAIIIGAVGVLVGALGLWLAVAARRRPATN